MELGQKIKTARLEANLSQRQLCGDVITRNMLSQIENGAARPSMDTLRYLSERLGKSVSYFLEEQAVTSPNQERMAAAREAYASGNSTGALELLNAYQGPDPVFDWEYYLLLALSRMAMAQIAATDGRLPYARALLEQAAQSGANTPYYTPALERERLLLLAQVSPAPAVEAALPRDDRELLLRAEAALARKDFDGCCALLETAWDHNNPRWHRLRGEGEFGRQQFAAAAEHFREAEAAYPKETIPRLEACYRELGDFKQAYEYACKQR